MVSLKLVSATAASALLSMVAAQTATASSAVQQFTGAPDVSGLRTMTEIGCFNTTEPLEMHGDFISQSRGVCQKICWYLKKNVMALSDGSKCWCGDLVPEADSKTTNSTCSTPCGGTADEDCGGFNTLWVQLTGLSLNTDIPNYTPSATPSATSTASSVAQSTQKVSSSSTTVVTPSSTPSQATSTDDGGPNKVGIAVGVVVGVLVLAAIIGGVFFVLRQKRRREVEEEFRRQANINSFTAGGKLHTSNSSMNDSRLDPEFMTRRASNGSIADNEDYSRRILKVTNA